MTQHERPTESEVLTAVQKHGRAGVDAATLVSDLMKDAQYSRYDVQRAIQRALEKGSLELGPKLHLQVREAVAA